MSTSYFSISRAPYEALGMTKHVLCCCLTVAVVLFPCALTTGSIGTPLDDYVYQTDPHYRWYDTGERLTGLLPWEKWEGVVLNMTSQRWLSSAEVDCSVWTHHLVVVTPGNYEHKSTALLIVGGGSNSGELPSATDELLILGATVAVKSKSLVAVLYQVPNQPCHFCAGKPRRGRSEDDLIAYTWAHFLDRPDQEQWPLRLPMTKAVIRAMDTVQSYADEMFAKVENYVGAGASKRGWTTWTAAATDHRVVGIIPIVMDALNFLPNIHHVYRSLGGWPVAFEPYYELNLAANIDTPELKQLMDIVDPFQYKDRLTIPRLVITTSNDEFFLLDDSAYFWNDLPGEKHMLILLNTDHSLLTGLLKLLVAVEAFLLRIPEGHELSQTTRGPDPRVSSLLHMPTQSRLPDRRPGFGGCPKYWWHINRAAGTIDGGVVEKHVKVILRYAYTTKGTMTRDFQWFKANSRSCPTMGVNGLCLQPVIFHQRTFRPSAVHSASGKRNYCATIPFPKEGYGASFGELRFAGPKVLTVHLHLRSCNCSGNLPWREAQGEFVVMLHLVMEVRAWSRTRNSM